MKFPFQVAVVAWVDLLGYGRMIADAHFNPLHHDAAAAIARLRTFHRIVSEHSRRAFPTLVMNDGAAAYRDLSLRSRSVTHDFLVRAWGLFNAVKAEDQANGNPGPRMVIAAGFRMRGRRAGIDQTTGHFTSIMRRFQADELSAEEAIQEASHVRRSFDVIPHLQANFAFTRAYVAESSGTAGGLSGPRCFVDLDLFDDPAPPWIRLGKAIAWRDERLNLAATFAHIIEMPQARHPEGGPTEVRDALQVAQQLAGEIDVLDALRKAAKSTS